jgi:hypothetical protein
MSFVVTQRNSLAEAAAVPGGADPAKAGHNVVAAVFALTTMQFASATGSCMPTDSANAIVTG